MQDDSDKPRALALRPARALAGARRKPGAVREITADADLAPVPITPSPPTPTEAWPVLAQHAQILLDMRRARRRRFLLRFALFVGVPTLATFLYTAFLATPRYVSEFEVTYQTYRPAQSLSSGLVQSIIGTSQNNTIDLGSILYEYVRSPALLSQLDKELNLRNYYSSSKIDFFSRMGSGSSREKFLEYYRWYVSVSEGMGGYLTVTVTAFDSDFAVKLANALVAACDHMVDGITARAREDEVRFADNELARQAARIRKARLALMDFQNAHGDLDPQRVATQLGQITADLEGQLAAARSQLNDALAYMSPNAPQVSTIKYKIAGLEEQLQQERQRLATSSGGTPYSTILDEYSSLQLEQEFAKDAYLAAQQGLEVAQADAARKQNYLVDFAPPQRPDHATGFFPLVYTATVFCVSLLAFGIGSLMVGAFRDQAGG
jgi:capsular polysaccharide transport system permease protein